MIDLLILIVVHTRHKGQSFAMLAQPAARLLRQRRPRGALVRAARQSRSQTDIGSSSRAGKCSALGSAASHRGSSSLALRADFSASLNFEAALDKEDLAARRKTHIATQRSNLDLQTSSLVV